MNMNISSGKLLSCRQAGDLLPGVIAISNIVVEHPELVAQRIARYAKVVGRESVIASVDCGFGTVSYAMEMHPTIAWAKLKSLVDGAAIASKRLF
jgi:5-methyltetrahydropteroyltriglutamate--homocysteine methyltransferase